MVAVRLDPFRTITNVHWSNNREWFGTLTVGHQRFTQNPPSAPGLDYYGYGMGSGGPETPVLIGAFTGLFFGAGPGDVVLLSRETDGGSLSDGVLLSGGSFAWASDPKAVVEIVGYGTLRADAASPGTAFGASAQWYGQPMFAEGMTHVVHTYVEED